MIKYPPMNLDHYPLTKDDVVVNLGAHRGRLTTYFATRVGRVIAVEPVQENYEALLEAIRVVGARNVTPLRAAIGSETRVGQVYIGTNDENHSTVRRFSGETQTVQVYTWNDLLDVCGVNQVRLAKVDVEGAELQWLRGMTRTLPTCVIMEEHSRFGLFTLAELKATLEAKGYRHTQMGLHIYAERKG